jgi:hypothetical protein
MELGRSAIHFVARSRQGLAAKAPQVFWRLWRLQIVLVVLLPLALPINLLAAGTALWTWKQVLVAGSNALFLVAIQHGEANRARRDRIPKMAALLIVVWGVCAMASLARGIGLLRSLYSFFYYIGPVSFMLMPYMALRLSRMRATLIAFVGVMTICGIGLAVDYFTDLPRGLLGPMGWHAVDDGVSVRRATFLFESPSNIFAFMSAGLVLALWWQAHVKSKVSRLVLLACALAGTVGVVLTLTRTLWWGLGTLWSFAPIALYARTVENRTRGAITFLAVLSSAILAGLWAGSQYVASESRQAVAMLERGQQFSSPEEAGNAYRFRKWREGIGLFSNPAVWLVGSGVGSGAGQVEGESTVVSNYESSFFLAFAEAGVLGLVLRYMPIALILGLLRRTGSRRTSLGGLVGLWAAIWCVTTAVAPSAGAYHGLLALFFMVGLSAVCREWEEQLVVGRTAQDHRVTI